MKANELMIGDLVYYIHTEDGIAPYREVICIQAEDLCRDACIIETHYEPIPLTTEILEKNGFEKLRISWVLRYNNYCIVVQFINDKWSIEVSNKFTGKDEKNRCDFISVCRGWSETIYVHQLQHALRLCGIKKEITL